MTDLFQPDALRPATSVPSPLAASETLPMPLAPPSSTELTIWQGATVGTTQLLEDAYDREAWKDALTHYQRLAATVEQAQEHCAAAPTLLQDLFLSLYKAVPTFSPEGATPLGTVLRGIVQEVWQTQAWQAMRDAGTVGDPVASSMATIALAEHVVSALDEETRAQLTRLQTLEEQMQQLFQQAQALQELPSACSEAEAERLAALSAHLQQTLLEHSAQAAPILAQVQETQPARGRAVRQAAREGLAQARNDASALGAFQQALGGLSGTPGTPQGSNPEQHTDLVTLAAHLHSAQKLQPLALLCGRLQTFAQALHDGRQQETPEEIVGITYGRTLERLLPSELALLLDPETELLFARKWVEGTLLQHELHAKTLEGQGPIIIALDSSGSMHTQLEGHSREVWGKAIALTLLTLARQQGRDLAILHFSEEVLLTQRCLRGQASLQEALLCADFFDGGGTSYEPWMEEALRLVDEAAFDRADVICLSDGLAFVGEELARHWNQRRHTRGMRVFGVLLDGRMQNEATQGEQTFRQVTDVFLPLQHLDQQETYAELFTLERGGAQ